MPRILLERRYWERYETYKRQGGRKWYGNTRPPYLDYFPHIDGTRPEKIIFNELARRRINFYFSVYFGDIPFTTDSSERYRPDFLLPDYNIIIDIQGVYWHTRPGKYESDYFRAALLEGAGWKIYLLTDLEIVDNPLGVLDQIPELRSPHTHGDQRILGDARNGFNPVAPIVSRIKERPKIIHTRWRKNRNRVKSKVMWQLAKRPGYETEYDPLFRTEDFDIAYLTQVKLFSQQWRDYIKLLGDYFEAYPEAAGAYPEEYGYWVKWRNWWERFRSRR